MSQLRLSDINNFLTLLELPVKLTPETANQLRQVVPSSDFARALSRAIEGDESAKGWATHQLRIAGLIPQQQATEHAEQTNDSAEHASPNADVSIVPEKQDEVRATKPSEERISKHVYGGQGALTFELDTTMSGVPTLAIDAAKSSGPRQYDWKSKIRVQLTAQELPIVASIFLGYTKGCEFMNHGPDKNKGFAFERQQGKIYCKLFSKGTVYGVPILPADIYYIGTLFLGQLQKQSPWLDMAGISMMLRGSSA